MLVFALCFRSRQLYIEQGYVNFLFADQPRLGIQLSGVGDGYRFRYPAEESGLIDELLLHMQQKVVSAISTQGREERTENLPATVNLLLRHGITGGPPGGYG